MVAINGQDHYTNKMYEEVERKICHKKEELRKQYEEELRKLQDQENQLPPEYQEKSKTLREEIEALKESLQDKEKKLKDLKSLEQNKISWIVEHILYYEMKLRAVREEAEQIQLNKDISTDFCSKLQGLHLTQSTVE